MRRFVTLGLISSESSGEGVVVDDRGLTLNCLLYGFSVFVAGCCVESKLWDEVMFDFKRLKLMAGSALALIRAAETAAKMIR
jgi:hypothetical protein